MTTPDIPEDIREKIDAAVFHYFNCNGECGSLPRSMAELARLIDYHDPAVNDEIEAALREDAGK